MNAFAAQQREKSLALAARHKLEQHGNSDEYGMRRKGEGKRSLRRRENAGLVHNPYLARPTVNDLLPPSSSAGGLSKSFASYPGGKQLNAIRNTTAPSPSLPTSEPTSTEAGKYTLSLKGVRQLLRKRGRRAEVVVGKSEEVLRNWVMGSGIMGGAGGGYGQPRVIDSTPVECDLTSSTTINSSSSALKVQLAPTTSAPNTASSLSDIPLSTRSLPSVFSTSPTSSPEHLSTVLTSFYTSGTPPNQRQIPGRKSSVPAIVELAHAPGHLVWAVMDPFERLIVHLLCRYYDLISFSKCWASPPNCWRVGIITFAHAKIPHLSWKHLSIHTGQTLPSLTQQDNTYSPPYRITHILKPSHAKPTLPETFDLMTPENTDLDTGESGSDVASMTDGGLTSDSESELLGSRGVDIGTSVVGREMSETESEDAPRGRRSTATGNINIPSGRDPSVGSDSDWSRAETESIGGDSEMEEIVWRPAPSGSLENPSGLGDVSFASTIRPQGDRLLASGPASESGDDADADQSDQDSIAGSMMMDSLVIEQASTSFAQNGVNIGNVENISGWTMTSSLPESNGFLSRRSLIEERRQSLGANAPFVSEFDLPVDLFPARRAGLAQGREKEEKPTFFEYLYG